ncbi:MAG: coat protein [Leptospiraceae bacterium]|nr:coat protein [Leptospiraceae bacterium]
MKRFIQALFNVLGIVKYEPTKTNYSNVHYTFGGLNLQLFANTNVDYLYPEFWAAAFDAINAGKYQLQNLVSRKYESLVGTYGDTVNVPISPSFTAEDWTPGSAITPTNVTQEKIAVNLDKSKKVTFNITGKEQTLSKYDLIMDWGRPAAEAILENLNQNIYEEMIKSPYVTNALSGVTESLVIDAGTALSNRKIGSNRALVSRPDDIGTLMKIAAFSAVYASGKSDIVDDGMITRRYGFNFFENNAISKYTPVDLTGAVNNGAGYAAGTTTMVVDGFNDDTNPIRKGDTFTVVGSSARYTVQSTTTSSSDTIGITFLPALDAAVVDDAVITFVGSASMVAFTPDAFALAARPYALLPDKSGVMGMVINYQGIPIRISVFHDGSLGLSVQYDILYGVSIIDNKRIQRIITA